MRRLWVRPAHEFQTEKEMRRLIDHLTQDRTRVAGRIGASLGSRRPQV